MNAAAVLSATSFPSGTQHVLHGLSRGLHLVVTANPVVVDTTLRTLRLAAEATAIGMLVGVPIGCAIGLGRSRWLGALRVLANGLARVPPVAVGLLVVTLLTPASPWGGGPLAGLDWYSAPSSAYLAQTLLAIPIVVALTSAAVQGVSPGLLDQARAFGAPGWRRGALALRESRPRMIAATLITIGITITAIGAVVVADAPQTYRATQSGGSYVAEPPTLALGAFQAFALNNGEGSDVAVGQGDTAPTPAVGVAYATVLFALFAVIAAALTFIQRRRARWMPLLRS